MSIARGARPEAKRAAEQVAHALDVSDPTEIAEIRALLDALQKKRGGR